MYNDGIAIIIEKRSVLQIINNCFHLCALEFCEDVDARRINISRVAVIIGNNTNNKPLLRISALHIIEIKL
jgi:hypothetical protein